MDALNFVRELLFFKFILLSRLLQMLVALQVKVRWPEAVLKRSKTVFESRLRLKRSCILERLQNLLQT